MNFFSQDRSKNWVVIFDSEPNETCVPTSKWLHLLRAVCTHDSIGNIWKVHLSFNQRQRRSLLEKEWSRNQIQKGADIQAVKDNTTLWTWPNVPQYETSLSIHPPHHSVNNNRNVPVTRTHIPGLEHTQTDEAKLNWNTYVLWIMDKLERDAFSFKEFVGMIHIETDSLPLFCFNLSSTWLFEVETKSSYYNYKLEQSCVHTDVIKTMTPHTVVETENILPLDCNTSGSCLLIQADCSMGKTSIGIHSLIEQHVACERSILLVTENRALASHFKKMFPQFSHYSCFNMYKLGTEPREQDIHLKLNPEYLICQIESIRKINRHYDVVVLDEITSCFAHVISSTLKEKDIFGPSMKMLIHHIKYSSFLYGFDADIPPYVFDFIADSRTSDVPHLIKYTHRPLLYRELFLVKSNSELLLSLEESLQNGANCVLVLQSVALSKMIFDQFILKASSILLINSEGASLVVNGESVYEKDDGMKELVLHNVDEHFSQVQLLVYTPSIKTGVSFELVHFDRVYGIACNKTASAREFQQSLLRVRNVSTAEYFVCLGNTHIGSKEKLDQMKINQQDLSKVLYPSLVQINNFNPGKLPALYKASVDDSTNFNAVQRMVDLAQFEKECSAWHFGIIFISYMCQQRGFLLDYLHHIEGFRNSGVKKQIPKFCSDIGTLSQEREERAKAISDARDIGFDTYLHLRQKLCEDDITKKQQNEMSKFMLRKQLGVHADFALTPSFVLTYMDHGEYVQFLRKLVPDTPKHSLKEHLRKEHEHWREILISKLKIIEREEKDEEERTILETALKMNVKPRYKKAEQALEFLNMFGFEGHMDDRVIAGNQLDQLWKTVVFSRANDLLYRLKHLFSSLRVNGSRSLHLTEQSTRRQFLGFTNSILHEGLGVCIQQLGSRCDQGRFALFVDVPLKTRSSRILRSKRKLETDIKDTETLELKCCKVDQKTVIF